MKKSWLRAAVTGLISTLLAFTFSVTSAADVPEGYHLIKGTWMFDGSRGGDLILYVDNLDNPTKGYLTKSGSGCTVFKQEVFPKKNDQGFAFETYMYSTCRMTAFTFIGPDAEGKYGGTAVGYAGAIQISGQIQQKK